MRRYASIEHPFEVCFDCSLHRAINFSKYGVHHLLGVDYPESDMKYMWGFTFPLLILRLYNVGKVAANTTEMVFSNNVRGRVPVAMPDQQLRWNNVLYALLRQ